MLGSAVAGTVAGDKQNNDEGETRRFRAFSDMVLVNSSVLDSQGRPIRDNSRLYESHAQKPITWFSKGQTPVSMMIVFDTSGSIDGKLQRSGEAVSGLQSLSCAKPRRFDPGFSLSTRNANENTTKSPRRRRRMGFFSEVSAPTDR